ncbi:hypothetical protein [Falsiroseomonas sp.]|uniref:hypothetical protein n=1 Tax=Falsiroseomonas sp. TaxID=2870721 RepID=UPI003569547D
MRSLRPLLAFLAFAPGLALAQQPVVRGEVAQRVSIVETTNARERSVLLTGPDGSLTTIFVGPEVRNFAQIRPGDRVATTVTEAVAISLAKADGAGPTGSAAVTSRAAPGRRPAGSVTAADRIRVRIDNVDTSRNLVAFITPGGTRREVQLRDPELRRFAESLRRDDEVDVVFVESVSVRVLPGN